MIVYDSDVKLNKKSWAFKIIDRVEKMTKTYHNGPVSTIDEQRKITDVFCLIVFGLFNFAMLGVAIHAWTSNNFSKLTTPYDPDGKGCGIDYPEYPYIYFASPHSDSLFVTTCVKKCPVEEDQVLQCQKNSVVQTCEPYNSADNTKAIQIYDTLPVRGVVCMPTEAKIQQQIYSALGAQAAYQKISSLSRTWVIILISVPLAILLAIVFVFIMRLTASIFVHLLLAVSIIALLALGAYFIIQPTNQYAAFLNTTFHTNYLSNVIGVILLTFGAIIAIMAFCFRDRIQLASSIVKVSTRFVNQNCPLMLVQIGIFIVMCLFVVAWIFEALGFYSMGVPTFEEHSLPFQHFKPTWEIQALGFIHLFYFFWGMMFFVHTGDFLVSGTVTSWYFQREEPYKQSLQRYFGYHMGSVCMGSFLMALLGFFKFLNEILSPKEEEAQGCMKTCRKIWNCCCFICVNWLFSCVNNGAYTFIHLSGDAYCSSALQVLAVRIKDIILTGVVTILSVLFQVLIRIGITALTCLAAYAIVKNVEPFKTEVNDTTLLMIIVGLLGFTVSSFFVSLYSQAMEAISVCYLIDKDAGGKDDKCPDELRDFLQEAKRENHTLLE